MLGRMLDCNRDHVLLFALIFCAIFLISFIAYPVISSQFDFEYAYNEGWNAYHQIDAFNGALYQNESRYVFTNYTPLSFFIVGYFSKFSDVILTGRALSTISFIGIVFLVAFICKKLRASQQESLFGAVMCIGLLGAYHRIYVGIDDPQLLGSAVSLLGLLVYLGRRAGFMKNITTLSILIVAGLIKQTLLTIPIVIALDLAFRDRRQGVRVLVEATVMVTAVILCLYLLFGYACYEQILSPRQYSIHTAATKTLSYPLLTSAAVPLAISFLAIYVRYGANRLILIYVVSALVVGALLSGGAGAESNQFIDLAIASSIAAPAIIRCLREDLHADHRLISATVLVAFYGPTLQVPYAVEQLRDGLSGSLQAAETSFHRDLQFMANYPGAAFCESPMLCFRSGREFVIDPFNASQAIRLGRVDPSPLLDKVARAEFAVIQLSTLEGHSFGPPLNGGADVEHEFRRLINERYRMVRTSGRRVFYLPK
jgi:hypothetical protein